MLGRSLFTILALSLMSAVSGIALPVADQGELEARQTTNAYWVSNIARRGKAAFNANTNYTIFRNVKAFGARGDGSTDDTAAINNAIASGNRCGLGCDSSTITPAIIYFPAGTYVVSSPIVQYYYSQFFGDIKSPPVIKAAPNFQGIAVIDSDPYTSSGANWYTNQNNFFRGVRNMVIDVTAMPPASGTCIHWQVAQASSLQNLRFEMVRGGSGNRQQGIFMDNGSGLFMSDIIFNGGNYGAFLGNQQFTTSRLTFNGCNTAIFMNWNWLWAFKSLSINNCGVGIDAANGGSGSQQVGSVLVQDSTFANTPVGVRSAFTASSSPATGGTLVLDNVDFRGSQVAVQSPTGSTILAGGSVVKLWASGRRYINDSGARVQQGLSPPAKPSGLLASNGRVFERAKPLYPNMPASNFVSIKAKGAKGDGVSDDTAAIQAALNSLATSQILYFDHGAYVVTSTIKVPKNAKIQGEIWPLIMAKGSFFGNQNAPKPVFQIGQPGDVGAVEIVDMIFETMGPAPGAIMMEWNVAASSQGAAGMWDTHFRIGGSAGTQLQSNKCPKSPGVKTTPNAQCLGAHTLLHVTKQASGYFENCWFWVADHELDLTDHSQINIYNGRGILVESTKPTWFYGTSSEHSVLYNYALQNAANVYMSAIQTETAYMQANPDATVPFTHNTAYSDPTFGFCAANDALCKKTWGLKILNSHDVLLYGGGLYSFFDNYQQTCLNTNDCQTNMIHVQDSQRINFFGLSTKASKYMVTKDGVGQVLDSDNRSNFCATLARWVSE